MSFLKTLKKLIPAFGLVAASLTAQAQQAQYTTYENAFPSQTPNKVEVLEFFSYACPHCAAIEPMVEKLAKEMPENTVLVPVPVAFNAAMQPMQQLFYSLTALNRTDLHAKVFDAIHKEKKRLFTRDAIVEWVVEQGVDKKAFEDAFDSFGVNTQVRRAAELTNQYKIEATPSFTVAGKYLTSPGMTGTYEGTINVIKDLLDKELKK